MKCWNCETELIWGGDHDIEDENASYSMVTNLSCPNCDCYFEVYYPKIDNEKKRHPPKPPLSPFIEEDGCLSPLNLSFELHRDGSPR